MSANCFISPFPIPLDPTGGLPSPDTVVYSPQTKIPGDAIGRVSERVAGTSDYGVVRLWTSLTLFVLNEAKNLFGKMVVFGSGVGEDVNKGVW